MNEVLANVQQMMPKMLDKQIPKTTTRQANLAEQANTSRPTRLNRLQTAKKPDATPMRGGMRKRLNNKE